jgi:hypothetical protein
MFLGREIARTPAPQRGDRPHDRLAKSAAHRGGPHKAREIVTRPTARSSRSLAQALLKYETITGEEVAMLLRGEKIDELKEAEAAEEKARLDEEPQLRLALAAGHRLEARRRPARRPRSQASSAG